MSTSSFTRRQAAAPALATAAAPAATKRKMTIHLTPGSIGVKATQEETIAFAKQYRFKAVGPFGAAIRGRHSGPFGAVHAHAWVSLYAHDSKTFSRFRKRKPPEVPAFRGLARASSRTPNAPKIRLGENSRPRQSHTTKHAGQCPAVRRVERLTNTRSRNPKRSIRQCHTKPRRVRQPPRNTGPSRRLCGQVLPTPRSLNSANRVVPRF